MITLQIRDGETVRIEIDRQPCGPIRCAECNGTDTEPLIPGCSGVIHPIPEPGDNERARARELFFAARAVVAAGQAWHRIGDPQSAERLSLAIGQLEAAIGETP